MGGTHGNDAPDVLPTPKGLNVLGAIRGGSRTAPTPHRGGRVRPLRGRQGVGLEGRCPWVEPTETMPPDVLPTPKGLNVVGRHVGAVREPPLRLFGGEGFDPSGVDKGVGLEGRCPWVEPTETIPPDVLPTPKGLNVVGCHVGAVREPPLRLIGGRRVRPLQGQQGVAPEGHSPWVAPTATDVVPLRGTGNSPTATDMVPLSGNTGVSTFTPSNLGLSYHYSIDRPTQLDYTPPESMLRSPP